MNDPARLRDSAGAAHLLLGAGALTGPSAAARGRALAFAGAATGLAASGTAAAAGGAGLVKSVLLCVCLGALGGGGASLAVSETVARLDAKPAAVRRVRVEPRARPSAKDAAPAPSVQTPEVAAMVDARAPELAVQHRARPVASPVVPHGSEGSRAEDGHAADSGGSLFDEQSMVESARAAVARGDGASALATLDHYQLAYPRGQFGPEALALRIEVLARQGDLSHARALGAEFRRRFPHHPLLSRVEAAVNR